MDHDEEVRFRTALNQRHLEDQEPLRSHKHRVGSLVVCQATFAVAVEADDDGAAVVGMDVGPGGDFFTLE